MGGQGGLWHAQVSGNSTCKECCHCLLARSPRSSCHTSHSSSRCTLTLGPHAPAWGTCSFPELTGKRKASLRAGQWGCYWQGDGAIRLVMTAASACLLSSNVSVTGRSHSDQGSRRPSLRRGQSSTEPEAPQHKSTRRSVRCAHKHSGLSSNS